MVDEGVGAFDMPQVLLEIRKQFTILVCYDLQGPGYSYKNWVGCEARFPKS